MAKDIIYDQDILIANGDFVLAEAEDSGYTTSFHAIDIIMDSKGQWYQSPLVGVGVRNSIGSKRTGLLKSEIYRQLRDDKFQIARLNVIFVNSKTTDIQIDCYKDTRDR